MNDQAREGREEKLLSCMTFNKSTAVFYGLYSYRQ